MPTQKARSWPASCVRLSSSPAAMMCASSSRSLSGLRTGTTSFVQMCTGANPPFPAVPRSRPSPKAAVSMQHKEPASMVLNGGIGRRLLNVRETAQYLGLEVDTVYKKARLRELPCVKVGRALRFDLKALERFVEQHTIETID